MSNTATTGPVGPEGPQSGPVSGIVGPTPGSTAQVGPVGPAGPAGAAAQVGSGTVVPQFSPLVLMLVGVPLAIYFGGTKIGPLVNWGLAAVLLYQFVRPVVNVNGQPINPVKSEIVPLG